MTLHPLTKELLNARLEYSPHRDEDIDRMVRGYLTGRAEWFKSQFPCEKVDQTVDQAFQIAPETLEEKLHAIRLKHDGKGLYKGRQEDFWTAMLKEFVQAAEEHFNNQPSSTGIGLIDDQTS